MINMRFFGLLLLSFTIVSFVQSNSLVTIATQRMNGIFNNTYYDNHDALIEVQNRIKTYMQHNRLQVLSSNHMHSILLKRSVHYCMLMADVTIKRLESALQDVMYDSIKDSLFFLKSDMIRVVEKMNTFLITLDSYAKTSEIPYEILTHKDHDFNSIKNEWKRIYNKTLSYLDSYYLQQELEEEVIELLHKHGISSQDVLIVMESPHSCISLNKKEDYLMKINGFCLAIAADKMQKLSKQDRRCYIEHEMCHLLYGDAAYFYYYDHNDLHTLLEERADIFSCIQSEANALTYLSNEQNYAVRQQKEQIEKLMQSFSKKTYLDEHNTQKLHKVCFSHNYIERYIFTYHPEYREHIEKVKRTLWQSYSARTKQKAAVLQAKKYKKSKAK